MTKEEKFYVFILNGVGAFIGNAVINGAIGWFITRPVLEVPVWKVPGVAADMAGTAFGVVWGAVLLVPIQVRKDFIKGKIGFPSVSPSVLARLEALPRSAWKRSWVLGLLALIGFGLPLLAGLGLAAPAVMTRDGFIWLKTIFAGVVGGLATPFVVLGILRDAHLGIGVPARLTAAVASPGSEPSAE